MSCCSAKWSSSSNLGFVMLFDCWFTMKPLFNIWKTNIFWKVLVTDKIIIVHCYVFKVSFTDLFGYHNMRAFFSPLAHAIQSDLKHTPLAAPILWPNPVFESFCTPQRYGVRKIKCYCQKGKNSFENASVHFPNNQIYWYLLAFAGR